MGPIILYAKQIMQELWRCKIDWDESVPQNIYTKWSEFVRQLELVRQIMFDRKLFIDGCYDIHLHGFCDACNAGFKACLYVRSVGKDGRVISNLLCAKSRVPP